MANTRTCSNQKNPSKLPLVAVAAAVLCLAVAVSVISANSNKKDDTASQKAQVITPGESLVIPTSEITSTAQFYPVEVNGTQMEIIAVRDSKGVVRTAFNTCQVCYSSGRGYYVQSGDYLVCQNCGSRFTVDQVEIISGGCNPWPILEENKTVTEDAVSISYDFLDASRQIFSRWKTGYGG